MLSKGIHFPKCCLPILDGWLVSKWKLYSTVVLIFFTLYRITKIVNLNYNLYQCCIIILSFIFFYSIKLWKRFSPYLVWYFNRQFSIILIKNISASKEMEKNRRYRWKTDARLLRARPFYFIFIFSQKRKKKLKYCQLKDFDFTTSSASGCFHRCFNILILIMLACFF